jgi:hypothetical protein
MLRLASLLRTDRMLGGTETDALSRALSHVLENMREEMALDED